MLPFTGLPVALYFRRGARRVQPRRHVPTRGGFALVGLVSLAAGRLVLADFWRCRHAHCLITGIGGLARSGFAFLEAVVGRSVIGGDEQLVFLGVLAAGVVFEAAWRLLRGTNAITR